MNRNLLILMCIGLISLGIFIVAPDSNENEPPKPVLLSIVLVFTVINSFQELFEITFWFLFIKEGVRYLDLRRMI